MRVNSTGFGPVTKLCVNGPRSIFAYFHSSICCGIAGLLRFDDHRMRFDFDLQNAGMRTDIRMQFCDCQGEFIRVLEEIDFLNLAAAEQQKSEKSNQSHGPPQAKELNGLGR